MNGEADCIFCGIVRGDLPATILDEDQRTVSFMDINPATTGHALVIPRRHSRDLMEIDPEDLSAVASSAQRLTRRIEAALEPDGFNLINSCGGAAWQTVFHFHLHVIPRYHDDPLKLPWVPTPGDPGEITSVAERIRDGGG